MLEYFLTVLTQVVTLFLLIGVGFVLGKMGRMNNEGISQLTFLLLYIVTPCVVWDTLKMDLEPQRIAEAALCAVLTLALYLCYSLIVAPLFRRSPPDVRASLQFAAIYNNVGFVGLPLVQAVLGDEARLYVVMAIVVFNVYCWVHGVLLMGGPKALSLRKALVNPGSVALVVGLPLLLGMLELPGSVDAAVGFLADLNTPLAMVIIGAQMSAVNMAESFRHGRIYAAAGLRLAVLPLFTALVLLPFHLSPMLYCSMVILSGTPVAGSTSMFAQRFGRSTAAAAQVITLSNILSVVTLPVLAVLAQALSGAL